MKKLIEYFNDNYGNEYGNIDYPRTKKQIYSTYQIIKEFGVKDDKLDELLKEINLPTPKTIEEKDLYSECVNNVSIGAVSGNSVAIEEMSIIALDGTTLTLTKDKFQSTETGVIPNDTTIELPTVDKYTEIHLFFKVSEESTLTLPTLKYQLTYSQFHTDTIYEIIFTYIDTIGEWVGGVVKYEQV